MGKPSLRVLLIEDDEDDFVLVKGLLNDITTYQCKLSWVQDYDAALRMMDCERHDICLLDYRLGERDGLELLKEATAKKTSIPIIFFTGRSDYKVDVEAMRAGAVDYLVKNEISAPLFERSIRYAVNRCRTEEALRKSEEKYRELVQNAHCLIVRTDTRGKVTFFNEYAQNLLGFREEEISGRSAIGRCFPHEDASGRETAALLSDIITVPETCLCQESEVVCADGRRAWIAWTHKAVRNEAGDACGFLSVGNDITLRRRAEETLAESESQLRFLSSKLMTAQEEERKRISVELHDGIGSLLCAVKFNLDRVLVKMEADSAMAESVRTLLSLTQHAIEESRRMTTDLRPPMLDDLGLVAAISWLCRKFKEVYGHIRLETAVHAREDQIPTDLRIVLYRVLQEALNNIAKHSGAQRVELSLTGHDGVIEMTIQDDGMGFDTTDALAMEHHKRGLGLTSMRERVELANGFFRIESRIGEGTAVRASWPSRPVAETVDPGRPFERT